MQRNLLSVVIAGLFAAAPAGAQDLGKQWATQGAVTVGPIITDIDSQDRSKAEQYRDLSDGALSSILLRGRGPTGYWIDFYGENFGRDDMYINLLGGQYDAFKYRLYTDWLTQNRLFNGRTPFSGAGSGDLRATFPQPDPATWNSVNIGFDRRDTGGYFEWQRNSPWYFRVDGNYVERDGTKIGSSSNGTSPGNGFTDLIIPVDYRTTNASAEFGYSTPQYHFAVNYLVSTFDSGFKTVTWNNAFWANGIDTTHLAPDNEYQRLGLNGTIRQLPWNSTLAARFTWDRLESDTTLATTALNGTGASAFGATNPNVSNFNGKVENTTFSLAWSAMPTNGVDTRVYYNYQKRDNESTQVVFDAGRAARLRRALHEPALHLRALERGLRRLLAVLERPPRGRRDRVPAPGPESPGLRRDRGHQDLPRVQEHDGGRAGGPPQVHLPRSRLALPARQRRGEHERRPFPRALHRPLRFAAGRAAPAEAQPRLDALAAVRLLARGDLEEERLQAQRRQHLLRVAVADRRVPRPHQGRAPGALPLRLVRGRIEAARHRVLRHRVDQVRQLPPQHRRAPARPPPAAASPRPTASTRTRRRTRSPTTGRRATRTATGSPASVSTGRRCRTCWSRPRTCT